MVEAENYGAVVGFIVGGIVGFQLGLWVFVLPFVGAAIGFFAVLMLQAALNARYAREKQSAEIREAERRREEERIRDEERLREAQRERERTRVLELQSQRNYLKLDLVQNAKAAVDSLASLPGELSNARGWTEKAASTYADGAFSPFWAAIEKAYGHLGAYRTWVDKITSAAVRHRQIVGSLAQLGGGTSELLRFPVQLDTGRVQAVVNEELAALERMVYEAQKHPVFAQIWEQRRTTAAVIAGFRNLEQAVYGMESALSESITSLRESQSRSNEAIAAAIASVAEASSSFTSEQIAHQRKLSARAESLYEEVYRQGHGYYPTL